MEPLKDAGLNVYPAFEGWYQNPDGSYTLLVGYYNRNKKQILDIPIGPENRIEPGGPDQGQPTHFLVGRGWGTVAIKVPKDFGQKKLTWTLTANGKTVSTPLGLTKGYQIEPFLDAGATVLDVGTGGGVPVVLYPVYVGEWWLFGLAAGAPWWSVLGPLAMVVLFGLFIIACGATLVIIAGGFDLTVGAIFADSPMPK